MKTSLTSILWLLMPIVALVLILDGEIDGRISVEPVTVVENGQSVGLSVAGPSADSE